LRDGTVIRELTQSISDHLRASVLLGIRKPPYLAKATISRHSALGQVSRTFSIWSRVEVDQSLAIGEASQIDGLA